jgi:hypothetical protein
MPRRLRLVHRRLRLVPPLRRGALCGLLATGLAACFSDGGAHGGGPSTSDPDTTTGETTAPATTTTTGTTTTTTTGDDPTTTTATTTSDCVPTVWYLDADGDLHGGDQAMAGCGPPPPGYTDAATDCDDADPEVHPGVDEVCDGVDNDCDDGTDEWPAAMAGACLGCTAVEHAAHIYYVCDEKLPWADARLACQARLGDLVIIADAAENMFVAAQLPALADRVWIGLNDIALEGMFVWVDATPLVTSFWVNGDPNNTDSNQRGAANCAAMLGPTELLNAGKWRDQVCTTLKAFTCEAAVF